MQPAQRWVFGPAAPKICDQYKPISALSNDIQPADQRSYVSRYYQFSNDVESKLAQVLQLISTIKRTTELSKKMDGIWNLYNLKSTGRIYTFCVLKCSEKFKVLDLP